MTIYLLSNRRQKQKVQMGQNSISLGKKLRWWLELEKWQCRQTVLGIYDCNVIRE